ncbi:MAG: TonB family protein [Nitrospirota bacterium]|nr:TonB family protein [Nitrospirota bacterium]
MERHSNLSFFLIISLAFHLSLVLLFRGLLLKPAISSDGSLAEVELLQVPTSAIIGKFPTKLQQFSGGKEKGGVSGKGKTSTEAPLASRQPAPRSELTVPIGKPPKVVKPSLSSPSAKTPPSPGEVPVPAPPSTAPSLPQPASPPVASVPAPVTPDRDVTPPLPKPLPLMRDQKREIAKQESPLDFPRMQIPFINEKDLEKAAKLEPKRELPEKNKGMSLDLEALKYESYRMTIGEDMVKGVIIALDKIEHTLSKTAIKDMMKLSGVVQVVIIIAKDGSAKEISLEKSSGFLVLDNFAMASARAAAPFNPIPNNLGRDEWHIRLMYIFNEGRRGVYSRY